MRPILRVVDPGRRAHYAYISGCLAIGQRLAGVYDFPRSVFVSMTGDVRPGHIAVFDHSRGCYVTGQGPLANITLYDHGVASAVQLRVMGTEFSGYDFGASTHFAGHIAGRNVSFYDYEFASYFQYVLS